MESSICFNRREFLTVAAKATISLSLTSVAAYSLPCLLSEAMYEVITIDLTQTANNELTKVGGSQYVSMTSSTFKIIVVRVSETAVNAFTSKCTHAAGIVGLPNSSGICTCPLHGSQFDTGGKVMLGPATTPLMRWDAVLSGTVITINTATSIIHNPDAEKRLDISHCQTNNTLTINPDGKITVNTIKVFDAKGRIIQEFHTIPQGRFIIQTGTWPVGFYLVTIETTQGLFRYKIEIHR
jgi:Rieske Fe-S protein